MKEPVESSTTSVARVTLENRAQVRATLLARRAALSPAQRGAADAAIGQRLDTLLARLTPASIGAYWPMRGEPELVGALTRWHEAGLTVALPRVLAPDAALQFIRWHPGAPLVRGRFNTREPAPGAALEPVALVIPCVGFDRHGHRLGYGGGFYDRTLAAMPAVVTIGVAYETCELAAFEAEPHDRPMDWVVTEQRLLGRTA